MFRVKIINHTIQGHGVLLAKAIYNGALLLTLVGTSERMEVLIITSDTKNVGLYLLSLALSPRTVAQLIYHSVTRGLAKNTTYHEQRLTDFL